MQSAFKHELHNMELIIIRYRIPLSVIPATSWYEHDQFEMLWDAHPIPDPSVHPIHGPSNTVEPLRPSHAQKREL